MYMYSPPPPSCPQYASGHNVCNQMDYQSDCFYLYIHKHLHDQMEKDALKIIRWLLTWSCHHQTNWEE